MALPNDVSTVRVVDSFIEFDDGFGVADGVIAFYPTVERVRSASGVTILKMSSPVEATLQNGLLDVTLPATDDPDVTPAGWGYLVVERFANRPNRKPYVVMTPAGPDLVLSELTAMSPAPALYRQVLSVNGILPDASGNVTVSTSVGSVEWANVLNKPATFPPATHTHSIADVTNLQSTLDGKESAGTSAASMSAHIAASDPHPQYLTPAEGNTAYDAVGAASTAVSAHIAASDPHTQYHTDARGDARYYTKSQSDTSLAGKLDTSSLNDTPRYVKFAAGVWPARGASARATFFIGGSLATNAPTDINLAVGDVWIPASA